MKGVSGSEISSMNSDDYGDRFHKYMQSTVFNKSALLVLGGDPGSKSEWKKKTKTMTEDFERQLSEDRFSFISRRQFASLIKQDDK